MTERQIAQRVVAVTGGGRGIGLATTRALVSRGARVAVGDLDADLATEAGGALGAALDVTSRDSFAAFLHRVETDLGPIDVLINNAGVMHVGPFLDEDDAWTRRQFDVNVHGVILGCKLALPAMLARRSGHIVNVASAAAKVGVPREAVYAATKHAVLGLSESLRAELRGTGVDLSVVMPGLVRTELAAGTLRGSKVLAPDDVAQAIVGVIERPRFDVYVPRSYRGLPVLAALLPRPVREAFLRAIGVGRNTAGTTPDERSAYENRAAGE